MDENSKGGVSANTPDLNWLKAQFANIKPGMLKASELEVYIAYMLMFEDLGKSRFELADKYGYTETKINRLLMEFGKRFPSESHSDIMKKIADSILESHTTELLVSGEKGKDFFSFCVNNPIYLYEIKKELEESALIVDTSFNKNVVKITAYGFAYIFRNYNEKLHKKLDLFVKDKDYKASKDVLNEFSRGEAKVLPALKTFLKENWVGIASLVIQLAGTAHP